MANITYADKNKNGSAPANQWRDVDANEVKTAVNSKVDKETGKGLSTNDYTTTEKNKLAGVATGATANSSDATLLSRANHTGTQTSASISDFSEAVQDAVAAFLGAGSNVVVTYDDAANTLTIAASGSGGGGLDAETVRDVIGAAIIGVGNITVAYNDTLDTITVSTTATVNSTDAALRDRSTHTGTQAISTITGLQNALDGKVDDATYVADLAQIDAEKQDVLVSGTNIKTVNGTSLIGSGNINISGGSKLFNVLDYGGVMGDNSANAATNKTAFEAALTAAINAKGGRVFVPAGVFVTNEIAVPAIDIFSAGVVTVEIVGEVGPGYLFGTVGSLPVVNGGSIVKSVETSAGNAVIKVSAYNGGFSGIALVVKDLEVRTYDNPYIHGIHAGWANQLIVQNTQVSTGIYNVQAAEPTHSTAGIITPYTNNGALTQLTNVSVAGYERGIDVYEHTEGYGINLTSCKNGLMIYATHHSIYFGRVCGQRNTRHVSFATNNGLTKARVRISQLNLERVGSGQYTGATAWQQTTDDIYDPSNVGQGEIFWAAVLGGTGAVSTITTNGASGLKITEIGAEIVSTNRELSLTDASTITWDYNSGNVARVTLGGNRTLDVQNVPSGATGELLVTQDGAGSRTLTLPGYKATAFSLSTAANDMDLLRFRKVNGSLYWTGNAFGPAAAGPNVLFDDFNRANSTTSIGNLVTPNTPWNVANGTWGINNNEGYCVTETNSGSVVIEKIWVEAGIADYTYSVDVRKLAGNVEFEFLFRYSDADNHLLLAASHDQFRLFKHESGTFTALGAAFGSGLTTTAKNLKVVTAGSSISAYLDNVLMQTVTSTFNQTATKVGLAVVRGSGYGAGIRFDNVQLTQ